MPPVSKKKLTLKTLLNLHQRICQQFDSEIHSIVQDCMNRPGDATARNVTLTLKVTPGISQEADGDACDVQVIVKSSKPESKTAKLPMKMTRNGAFFDPQYEEDEVEVESDEE